MINDKKSTNIFLTDKILNYCGYKIINNKLVKSKYEPDPNKKRGNNYD